MRNKDIQLLPLLPEEVIFQILKRVPARELQNKFKYICKSWHNLISSTEFIAQNTPHNKSQLLLTSPTSREFRWRVVHHQAKRLEMEDKGLDFKTSNVMRRMGKIRSSCNGLILVDDPKQIGLFHVMNVLAKCCLTLPKCGSHCPHKACGAALGFDPGRQEYKVVHIYADGYGFEIFILGSSDNAWKRIPGPFKQSYERPFDIQNFRWRDPVSINGQVFHWNVDSNDFIISLNISDEKSIKIFLPFSAVKHEGCSYDLLEMGGKLAFVYRASITQIDIWILEDFTEKKWIKRHSIMTESTSYTNFNASFSYKSLPNFMHLFGVAAFRDGEVVMFKHKIEDKVADYSYLYDVKQGQLKKFRIKSRSNFVPHRESLICWKNEGELLKKRLSDCTPS